MMITCPWCGTTYTSFRPNCDNCGGTIAAPAASEAHRTAPTNGAGPFGEASSQDGFTPRQQYAPESPARSLPQTPRPPAPPREVPPYYLSHRLFNDGWAVAGLVFLLIGVIFIILGFGLTLGYVTAFVGVPFLGLGMVFLAAGVPIMALRTQRVRQEMRVMREGQAGRGEIIEASVNPMVRVNRKHPWTYRYRFQAIGREYTGEWTTLDPPRSMVEPGSPVYVLYLPENPEINLLYPSF